MSELVFVVALEASGEVIPADQEPESDTPGEEPEDTDG